MKEIKIFVIIIIILLCILGVKALFFDNKHDFTKDEIVTLLKEGVNYNNYSCKYTFVDEDYETIRMVKGKREKNIGKESLVVYSDFESNKQLMIRENSKIAVLKDSDIQESNYMDIYFSILEDYNYDCKHIKNEEINNFECIVAKLVPTKDKVFNEVKLWIDEKTGLIVKAEVIDFEDKTYNIDYNLELDNVTDSDVEFPNLTGYNVTNI